MSNSVLPVANNKKRKVVHTTRKMRIIRENSELTLLAIPAIVLIFVFCYMPMFGMIIAFKEFNPNLGIFGSQWVGLRNFEFFFTSQDAWRVMRNTVLYSLDFMFTGLAGAVIVALLLYNLTNRTCIKIYNTVMILPNFLSMVLIAYIVYAILNPVAGVLNRVIRYLGGAGTTDWYSTPQAWPLFLTIINLWKSVGVNSIIYYACLMSIDSSLHEAADLDGASKLDHVRYIALPHLVPVMTITTILAFGNIFNGDFGLFYQTTRDVGKLYPTTDIINTYVFRSMVGSDLETSSAVGVVQSVLGLVFVFATNMVVKKINPDNSMF